MYVFSQIPSTRLSNIRIIDRIEPISRPQPEQNQPSPTVAVDVVVDESSDASPPPQSKMVYGRILPTTYILLPIFMFGGSTYRARERPWDILFVLLCYTILLSLFYCLRKYEHLDSDAPPRRRRFLKFVILFLSIGLNVAFACRASKLFAWPFAAVIWASTATVALIGYFTLFVWSDRVGDDNGALPYSKLNNNSTNDSNNNNNKNNNCKEDEKYYFYNELSPEEKA